jgi:hypothetical protein
LLGNALVMTGEKERLTDLRGETLVTIAQFTSSACEGGHA